MPLNFIYCREYGLQPAIPGLNFGKAAYNGNPLVIANINVKPDGQTVDTRTGEILIQTKQILYVKLIQLSSFNGYDNLYVGKKTNLAFQNVAFDFTNDKWRIRDFNGHPLNNTKFNVYDRNKIKSILSQFLTSRVDEVFNLMYTTITTADGLKKFLSILEAVMEYKDEFFNILKPYEVAYVDPYTEPKLTNSNSGTGGNVTGTQVETNNNNTFYYVGGTLLLLWVAKKIRNKKSR